MSTQKEQNMSREPGTRVTETRDHGSRVVNGVEVRIQELVWNDTDGRSWDVYRVSDGQCLTMDHSFDGNPGDDEIAELLETPRDRYGYEAQELRYIVQRPTHVVVDTIDGYTFNKDASGELFDGPRAAAFAEARNNEQNPGYKSYEVFYLSEVPSFEPKPRPDSPRWVCGGCGQEWPAQTSAQIIAQNARAAVTHPGIGCQPTQQCDAFDCDDQHEVRRDTASLPVVDEEASE
jgi:hypothetical protein